MLMDASTIDETGDMKGPTPSSNWVIPGKLIAGAYPCSLQKNEAQHRETIASIIDAGVTTIVCLMPEEELALFRPYKEIAMQYAAQEMRTVAFLSFPIADGFITMDSAVMEFIPTLALRVASQSECVYVHCKGGHGRTGTIVALLLVRLYNIDAERALHLTSLFHRQRETRTSKSPQTRAQCDQVRRLGAKLRGPATSVEEASDTEQKD